MDSPDHHIRAVYDRWHAATVAGDAVGLASLYAEDAVLETAAVLTLWPDRETGIVNGREEIERFFTENFEVNAGVFAQWHRNDVLFSNGRLLLWEYPRVTPDGEQAGLVESMDVDPSGEITAHRVYWGWRGVLGLLAARDAGGPARRTPGD
jgi:steroid Delta-isomerase